MNKKNLLLAGAFILGFALAAFLLHLTSGESGALRAARDVTTITPDELRDFFQAVEAGDFPAMASLGKKVFVHGRKIADAEKTLAGYQTNSLPPYTVYALYIAGTPEKTSRVMLALDQDDRIESFLAEEMPVQ